MRKNGFFCRLVGRETRGQWTYKEVQNEKEHRHFSGSSHCVFLLAFAGSGIRSTRDRLERKWWMGDGVPVRSDVRC